LNSSSLDPLAVPPRSSSALPTPANLGLRVAGVEAGADVGVACPGARCEGALPAAFVLERVGRDRARGFPSGACSLLAGFGPVAGGEQAAAVPGNGLVSVFGQVVPHMPAIGDLDRVRCRGAGGLGVRAGPVPADHGCAGVRLQPCLHGGGLPVRQHVHHVAGVHVDQHGAVHVPFTEGKVVNAEYFRCRGGLALGEGRDQPQDRR